MALENKQAGRQLFLDNRAALEDQTHVRMTTLEDLDEWNQRWLIKAMTLITEDTVNSDSEQESVRQK